MSVLKSKIIAFEALDNCFKETNIKAFIKNIKILFPDTNIKTEAFPRYGNISCAGTEKWLDGSLDRDHMKKYPEAINSLYAIDRLCYWYESVHGQKRNIDSLLSEENPSCFVFDRYSISNAVYNPLIGEDTTVDDLNFEPDTFGIPKPDIVIWLRMQNFDTYIKLLAEKENKDANEVDIEFLKKVWERSERLIKSNNFPKAGINLIVIDLLKLDEDDKYTIIKSKEEIAFEIIHSVLSVAMTFIHGSELKYILDNGLSIEEYNKKILSLYETVKQEENNYEGSESIGK